MKYLAFFLMSLAAMPTHASLCETGRRQAPIDIATTTKRPLPPLEFHYQAADLKIADDGHTVRVRFDKGQSLKIGKDTYTLQQFHFHTPGGDKIGGEEFPMAAHLLHKSAKGQLLALVVLFRLGAENALLNQVLPLIPAKPDGDHTPRGTKVDTNMLLPHQRSYYRYSGSVTAPPCTEGVDWIVMKQPLALSTSQLAAWRARYADNARAVQPLYQRMVMESQ